MEVTKVPIFLFKVVTKVIIKEDCWDAGEERCSKSIDERQRKLRAGEEYEVNFVFRNFYGRYANLYAHGYTYDIDMHHCEFETGIKQFYGQYPEGKNWEEFDPRNNGYIEVKAGDIKENKQANDIFEYGCMPEFTVDQRLYLLPPLGRLHEVIDAFDFDVKLESLSEPLNSPDKNPIGFGKVVYIEDTTELVMSILFKHEAVKSFWYVDIADPDNKKFICIDGGHAIKYLHDFMQDESPIMLTDKSGDYKLWCYSQLPSTWQQQLASYCCSTYAYTAKEEKDRLTDKQIVQWWLNLNAGKLLPGNQRHQKLINFALEP